MSPWSPFASRVWSHTNALTSKPPESSMACRYLVTDRMDRSGMRWVMSATLAVLDLRCSYLSNLWDEFIAFQIQREAQRL